MWLATYYIPLGFAVWVQIIEVHLQCQHKNEEEIQLAKKGKQFRDLKGLGIRLKQVRNAKKLSQLDVGALMDVSNSAVRYWEDGTNEPPLEYIAYLIESGDCDPYWLLFGDEPM